MEISRYLTSIKSVLILFGCLTFGQVPSAFGQVSCPSVHDVNSKVSPGPGATFLHQKNPALHMSNSVQHRANHVKNITGRTLQKPTEKVQAWIDKLELSYKKYQENPKTLNQLKRFFYDQYVTKPSEVPESFFKLQVQIARERGHGNISLSDQQKKQLVETAIGDQKKSLDEWIEYFMSKDSESYPIWTKYWAITSVAKMGKYDPASGTFGNRSKGQMSPFPELNREALAYVIDALIKKVEGKSLDDIQDAGFLSLLEGSSFSKLYGNALQRAIQNSHHTDSVAGKWIVYKQGSDPQPLVDSLNGMNTGWCTAGYNTARNQLQTGNFHIFYSNDENGVPRIPRIAIRMEGDAIAEIRGTAEKQNLDFKIAASTVLSSKLKEFGEEGDKFLKKTEQMRLLSVIENKIDNESPLSTEELNFIYEVKGKIIGFGYHEDPRIEEIRSKLKLRFFEARNLSAEELRFVYNFRNDDGYSSGNGLSQLRQDILEKRDLEEDVKRLYEGKVPAINKNSMRFDEVYLVERYNLAIVQNKTTMQVELSKDELRLLYFLSPSGSDSLTYKIKMNRDLEKDLIKLYGSTSPHVDERASYQEQTFQKSLPVTIPLSRIEQKIKAGKVLSTEDLKFLYFPKYIYLYQETNETNLRLKAMRNVRNMKTDLSQILNLRESDISLTLEEALTGDKILHYGSLDLGKMNVNQELRLPRYVIGSLSIEKMDSASEVLLPEYISGPFYIRQTSVLIGVRWPRSILGDLVLDIDSARNIRLPETLDGGLTIRGLNSAAGLVLPRHIENTLEMNDLKSIEGLVLPEFVGGWYEFRKIPKEELKKLPQHPKEMPTKPPRWSSWLKGLVKDF